MPNSEFDHIKEIPKDLFDNALSINSKTMLSDEIKFLRKEISEIKELIKTNDSAIMTGISEIRKLWFDNLRL